MRFPTRTAGPGPEDRKRAAAAIAANDQTVWAPRAWAARPALVRRRADSVQYVAMRGSDQAVKAIRVRLAATAVPSGQVRAGASSRTAATAVGSRARRVGVGATASLGPGELRWLLAAGARARAGRSEAAP